MTGSGTVGDPYLIYDVNDLQAVNDDLDAYYELANDIDASATSGWNGGEGFVAIGRTSPYFTGQFDGNNHTIDGLYINQTICYQGLFGLTDGAVIEDVILTNVNITTWGIHGDNFGGLVGYADDTNITNCHVSGSLATYKIGSYAGDYGGMLCGEYYATDSPCSITNCSTGGTIYGEGSADDIGGLVGLMYSDSAINSTTVSDCHSSVNIETAGFYIGGLIGQPYGGRVVIADCYATGNLTGVYSYSGGLIGGTWTGGDIEISRCYATGNITAVAGGDNAGGFIGMAYQVTISQCFATGNVVGGSSGGFAGDVDSSSITNCYARGTTNGTYCGGFSYDNNGGVIDKCYATGCITDLGHCGGLISLGDWTPATASFWDTQTTGLAVSDSGTGKTTAQMKTKSTFTDAGWDFTTIWAMCVAGVAGYPCLLGVTPDCAACAMITHRHHPTIPTEPNRGKELSRMGSL